MEIKDIGKFASNNFGTHNPKDVMQRVLKNEIAGRNFRFVGTKI